MSRPAACRAFEERLVRALDRSAARWPLETPADGDEHLAECADCRSVVAVLRENLLLLSRVAPAAPSATLLTKLAALFGASRRRPEARGTASAPTAAAGPAAPAVPAVSTVPASSDADSEERAGPGRSGAEEVLGLLKPGVLARPVLSEGLLAMLARIPVERPRGKVVAIEAARERRARRGPLSLLSDWRVAVTLAYAATLVLVAVLRLDPLSAAKSATADLTAAGEEAIITARAAAEKKFAEVRSRGSFRDQLDYRLYRAMAVGRARATAYAGLVFERVFGSEEPATAARGERRAPDRRNEGSEQEHRSFRS